MRIFTYIIILILLIFGFTFACLNAELVSINYYIAQRMVPLSLLIAIALFVGAIIGWLSSLGLVVKLKKNIFVLSQKIKQAEKEIEKLQKDLSEGKNT